MLNLELPQPLAVGCKEESTKPDIEWESQKNLIRSEILARAKVGSIQLWEVGLLSSDIVAAIPFVGILLFQYTMVRKHNIFVGIVFLF